MCKAFNIAPSSYYLWCNGPISAREQEDEDFKEQITEIYQKSDGRYGHRPIYQHLNEYGRSCGRDRTLRLMKELNIEVEQKKRFKPICTQSNHDYGYYPNLLKQVGSPQRCDQVWATDTTFLKTEEGWCYLATVMDLYSRRIVGWSVSINNDTNLTCQALEAAVMTRGGKIHPGLIHHSDRGSTYASDKYASLLSKYKMRQSMSAKGNCYDNAAMESFYGRYKTCSHLPVFSRVEHARTHAFEYIEVFYNRFRKHSSLGYKNPVQFEEISNQLQAKAVLPACIQNN